MSSTLLIIGLLAVGGWCVFMGPCKEWFSQLTSGIGGAPSAAGRYGLDEATYNKIKTAVTSPEAQKVADDYSRGKISFNEMREKGLAIAEKYSNFSHSYLGRYQSTISI